MQVNFDFQGKAFIVTGASSGMGKQIASELAASGGQVLAIARREEKLRELQQSHEGNIVIAPMDVDDAEKTAAAIEDFIAQHGRIQGFVHAAGIQGMTPLKIYDERFAEQMMRTSLWDGMRMIQQLHRKKYSEDGASFLLFSSTAAFWGQTGMFAYSASKSAVCAAVKSLAKELSPRGLRINAICPGRVKTPMTEGYIHSDLVNRHLLGEGETTDISGLVMFLLSDRARWITGTEVIVDGGFLVS